MHGASGRQVLGDRPPLAARAQNVHHAVDHLAHDDAPFPAAPLARRNERRDMRPLLIGQVARIAQAVAVVAGAVLGSPHRHLTKRIGATQGITSYPATSSHFTPTNRLIRLTKSPDGHSATALPPPILAQ